jgi:histidine triad (HIT) family protein
MENCIFCRILAGDIPSRIVYEDDAVVAFLDINPAAPGHTLVVPKEHFNTLLDVGVDTIGPVFSSVKTVAELVKTRLEADGFNLLVNQGRAAGQLIEHFHVHIIPRYEDDQRGLMPPKLDLGDDEMDQIAEKLRSG